MNLQWKLWVINKNWIGSWYWVLDFVYYPHIVFCQNSNNEHLVMTIQSSYTVFFSKNNKNPCWVKASSKVFFHVSLSCATKVHWGPGIFLVMSSQLVVFLHFSCLVSRSNCYFMNKTGTWNLQRLTRQQTVNWDKGNQHLISGC